MSDFTQLLQKGRFHLTNKDGSTARYVGTVRYASFLAMRYSTLEQYAFFVIVQVRYVGMVSLFCNGTVRWYAVGIKNHILFAHCARFLYAEAKDSRSRR